MAQPTTFFRIFPLQKYSDSRMYLRRTGMVRCFLIPALNLNSVAGYSAPENLQSYAVYLDSRIRAYRDLKHDAIRVQADSNRDMRNGVSIDQDSQRRSKNASKAPPPAAVPAPSRSKTIMGRKLRVMTVEKGLLRETKAVHRMIDTLVDCRVRKYPSTPFH